MIPASNAALKPASLLDDTVANLRAGVQLALLLPRGAAALRPGGARLLTLAALTLIIGLAADVFAIGAAAGHVEPMALPHLTFWVLAVLVAAAFIGWLPAAAPPPAAASDPAPPPATVGEPAARLAVALAALVTVWTLLAEALGLAADASARLERWHDSAFWVLAAWMTLAGALAALRVAQRRWFAGLAVVTLAALALLGPPLLIDPAARLWVSDDDPQRPADDDFYAATTSEDTFYGQSGLLEDALDQVAPGEAGVPRMFFLGFAGFGPQDVFAREVGTAALRVAARFGTEARSVVLANDHRDPLGHPFASLTSLNRTLDALAEKMNTDDDVLFLLLSSHGRQDGTLEVSMWPYRFAALTPQALREALDASGIRNRVIVVSSCYSGSFVTPLATPHTMVITASRADRNSFGCDNGADWTWFGQAFFDEAMRLHEDLEAVFADAAARVAEREHAEGRLPSEPQLAVGERIRERLGALDVHHGLVALNGAAPARDARAAAAPVAPSGHLPRSARAAGPRPQRGRGRGLGHGLGYGLGYGLRLAEATGR